MPRYMLDTDTCSYIMKRSTQRCSSGSSRPVTEVCMSVITKAELLYGVEVSPRRAQDAAALARSSRMSKRWISPMTRHSLRRDPRRPEEAWP